MILKHILYSLSNYSTFLIISFALALLTMVIEMCCFKRNRKINSYVFINKTTDNSNGDMDDIHEKSYGEEKGKIKDDFIVNYSEKTVQTDSIDSNKQSLLNVKIGCIDRNRDEKFSNILTKNKYLNTIGRNIVASIKDESKVKN